MPTPREFSEDQVEAAIDYVITNAAEEPSQPVGYADVFDAAGLPSPQALHLQGESHLVSTFMARFHHLCMEQGLPPLDSLVVHVAGPRKSFPGIGYFRINGLADPLRERTSPKQQAAAVTFWESQKQQCVEWGERRRAQAERSPASQ